MATPVPGGGSDESSPQQQASCQVDDQLQPVPSASRRERLRGGYECEIVRLPEKIQTECSICLQVLKEPQLISCCGHHFCRSCIERVKKDGKNCPLCNEAEFTLMHNKGLERSMKEFEVFCTHRKSGCEWIGELRMLEQHLNVNPEAEKQLEGCEFVELECMYECGHCFQRCILGNHQINECPNRPFSCDYCREYESTFEDVVNNHYPVCKCYPLSCPNNCTPYAIERQNLQHHLDNDCLLQVVNCDFHYAGCEVRLQRRNRLAHLAENFTHMSLLAAFNQKLIQKNDKMAKMILEKNEEIKQLTEDLGREVVVSQTAIDDLKQENEALRQETQTLKNQLECESFALKDVRQEGEELRKNITSIRGELASQKKAAMESRQEMINRSERKLTAAAIRREEVLKDGLQQKTLTLKNQLERKTSALKEEILDLKEEFGQLKKDTRAQHLALQASAEKIHHHVGIVPVQHTMTDFVKHKRDNDWYSDPFYTHPHGYKMQLNVCPDGNGGGRGTHVSVFACLMRGEFDDYLKWPFRGVITIQLLNQLEDKEHHTETINFTDRTPDDTAGRVTTGERSLGRGKPQFIAHGELNYNSVRNRQYLKNGRLCFRVTKVELN